MTDRRGDTRLASESWESLMRLHAHMMREYQAAPWWKELSMREYDVLYQLAKQPDAQRICDLQNAVVLSQPALSRLIERLEQRGYLIREQSPRDARSVLVQLTDEGRAIQRNIGRKHAKQIADALYARVGREELESLERACRAIYSDDVPGEAAIAPLDF